MLKGRFFAWCESRGFTNNRQVAEAVRVSSQTVRNWKSKGDGARLASHLALSCRAVEHLQEAGRPLDSVPAMTADRFITWMKRNGFGTYEAAGEAFGMTRQGVQLWFARHSFPPWLGLSCLGYDLGARIGGPGDLEEGPDEARAAPHSKESEAVA